MAEASKENTLSEKRQEAENYFKDRMSLYGITDELNQVKLWRSVPGKINNELVTFPVFSPCDDGIEILVYSINRSLKSYKNDQEFTDDGNEVVKRTWSKDFKLVRYTTPRVDSKGKEHKYHIPKGAGTQPFFPPQIIEKFEKKEKIKTLVLTEGYFKAFKGCMHGLDVIGLSSITHYKNKETGTLHPDILAIISTCKVEKFIWLADADANRISIKALSNGDDIYKRPAQFFNTCQQLMTLLSDYDFQKFFAYIVSENIEGEPKGLDDLLIALPDKVEEIIEDLTTYGKPPTYFWREDMSISTSKIRKHFYLHNVNEFVEFHSEQMTKARNKAGLSTTTIPEIKNTEFVWNGTKYSWDHTSSECKISVPADAKRYFRVGDIYYEKIQIPNKYGQLEHTFHRRLKQTIIDDHKQTILTHVPKYKAFCNVPDHVNYQDVIHNCYNMYFPFEHEAEEGDCPHTLTFMRHIFGNRDIKVHHKEKGEIKVNELELGLDYVQLLYTRPQQMLPILCLVSKEQGTGKTTFVNYLKLLFTQNAAIVGNADLANDFNAFWAGKLLIICEEAKIDKTVVVEKVKALSTGNKIFMNAKGKDHIEMDFFAKFIFNTNNEENFIYASEDDVRYWVRKIPPVQELFVNLLEEMQEEIPAFIDFLTKRKLVTEKLHRAWFYPDLIRTEALKKVIAFSQSTVEKELREHLRGIFFEHGVSSIMMTVDAINESFFRNKYERKYLRNVLTDKLKVDMYYELEYNGIFYSNKATAKETLGEKYDEKLFRKVYKTKRHSYPRWERVMKDGSTDRVRVWVSDNGRPFVFPIEKFLLKEEIETRWIDPDAKMEVQMNESLNTPSWGQTQDAREKNNPLTQVDDGLPF